MGQMAQVRTWPGRSPQTQAMTWSVEQAVEATSVFLSLHLFPQRNAVFGGVELVLAIEMAYAGRRVGYFSPVRPVVH